MRPWLLAIALVAATFAAYVPAFGAGFVWDDDDYVTANPLLRAPDGLLRIWFSEDAPSQYFPLVYTTFRLEYALWGLDPLGYHVVNVALHALNALLVWRLLARLAVPGAWLAAAIFALHPVHVESVAWITERKNVLSTFFFLASLLAWMRFALEDAGKRFWGASFALYALALTAKTTACTLPAAQLLVLWLRGREIDARRVAQVLPFLLLGIAMGLFTVIWERVHQGTQGERFELGWLESTLVASRALWFYLGKLVLPVRLTFSYPKFEVDPHSPGDWLPVALGGLLLFALWRWRSRLGRGPLAAAVFFIATLSPMLGFIPLFTFLYTYVADHYQYVASLGPIALAAAAGVRAFEGRKAGPVAAAALLATLAVLTFQQCRVYESPEILWRDVIAKNPSSWMAYTNLGRVMLRSERWQDAIPWYEGALRVRPELVRPHLGLANAYAELGDPERAQAEIRRALAKDPDLVPAHQQLAELLEKTGERDGAIVHWREWVRLAPRSPGAHQALGRALARQGRPDEARRHFAEAARLRAVQPE